jgi:ABC-type multidrug transport system ATPase subunit
MLGLSRREIADRFDEIVRFAELDEFIDAPVKTYSSGMYMRLGFAVAINVDPDVLLVDEVLAVGDEAFTHKCLDKFAEFRRRGRTILLVTHSLDLVTRFCDQALWLDSGVVKADGDPKRVIDAYLMDVARAENQELAGVANPKSQIPNPESQTDPGSRLPDSGTEPPDMFQAAEGRWGSREVEITGRRNDRGERLPGASLQVRRAGRHPAARPRQPARQRLCVSESASSMRMAFVVMAPTRTSRARLPMSCPVKEW